MSNDNKKTKNNASCEEKQGMCELTEEELEKVTGGRTGAIPLRDDSVAAKLADVPTSFDVIKRIDDVVGSGDQNVVKAVISEVARQ